MQTRFKKIKKITRVNISIEVFDLTVKNDHNFFVNNKLVHNCLYCYVTSYKASLYSSFFDNTQNMGFRYCKPKYFRTELEKLLRFAGIRNEGTELQRAFGMKIPIRFGIRFEDFLPIEGRKKISLDCLQYLAEVEYPVMINTKSDLIGREDYVRALTDNKAGSAVHMTIISSDNDILKKLEPGAPSFQKRIQAIKNLTDAGIRVVARIEPFMPFITDQKERVDEWIERVIEAGSRNVTLDTYSWSANAPGIRRQMEMTHVDYDRMFLAISDSQWLGSLLLTKFIEYLKESGLRCSTFDFGSSSDNSDERGICCEVGDIFDGFNYGCNIMAIKKIISNRNNPTTWGNFNEFVEFNGGWLSDSIRNEVWKSWNLEGNPSFNLDWAQGLEPIGYDGNGDRIWIYRPESDFREELLKGLLKIA